MKFQVSTSSDIGLNASHREPCNKLTRASYKLGDKSISSDWLNESGSVYAIEDLSGERSTAFAAWNKALFDSSSEGIEDTILR